jgi:hypothetical protein
MNQVCHLSLVRVGHQTLSHVMTTLQQRLPGGPTVLPVSMSGHSYDMYVTNVMLCLFQLVLLSDDEELLL